LTFFHTDFTGAGVPVVCDAVVMMQL